jgi:BASS family bile acid:Na+ symporter
LPIFEVVRGVFLITTVPVAFGMWLRQRFPAASARHEPRARQLATGLFILIVVATFIGQREAFATHFTEAGPAAMALCVLTMLAGHGLGRLARIDRAGRIAITVESGLQNAGLAIFLALSVLQQPTLAIAGVIYALLMNVCAIVFVGIMRQRAGKAA